MYPKQYKLKSVWDQIDMIQEIMPIDFDEGEVEKILRQPLPEGAEGLFVIPPITISPLLPFHPQKQQLALKSS